MNKYKADLKDRRILYELDMNGRVPISTIAKKVKLSTQVVDYRIKNMEKKGVIQFYRTLIDISKLGFLTYRLYIRYDAITPEKENEIVEYLKKHPHVMWIVNTSGGYDLELLFLARNFVHFEKIVREIMKKYGKYLRNNVISVSIANFHHKRDWLIKEKSISDKQLHYGGEPQREKIDDVDLKIINILSLNARMSNIEIAKQLKMAPNSIRYRIKNLERRGILQAYRPWIDINKLGNYFYKALVKLKYLDDQIEKKILSWCKTEPRVEYLVTCIGPWNIEIEVEVPDDKTFREIMTRFKNVFSDLIVEYQTLHVYAEHKVDYFPLKKLE